jgi:hypothetical protein
MTPSPGPISALEVYPISEAARRLGWGRKTMTRAQRQGLKTVMFGRQKYVRGESIIQFFKELEREPTND